jgi:hypothetical protein
MHIEELQECVELRDSDVVSECSPVCCRRSLIRSQPCATPTAREQVVLRSTRAR